MGHVVTRHGSSNLTVPSLPVVRPSKRDIGQDPLVQEAVMEQACHIIESFQLFEPPVRQRMLNALHPAVPRHTNGDFARALAQHTRGLPEALVDAEGLDRAKVRHLAEKAIAGEELEVQIACRELLTSSIKEGRIRSSLVAFWLRGSQSLEAEDLDILFKLAEISEQQGGVKQQSGVFEEGPFVDVFKIPGVNRRTEEIAARLLEGDKKESRDEELWKSPPPAYPTANFCRAIELALHRVGFTDAYIEIELEKPMFGARWTVYL